MGSVRINNELLPHGERQEGRRKRMRDRKMLPETLLLLAGFFQGDEMIV
jgi:hypothetical protein